MIVSIGGQAGSGKSTIAKLLSYKLGYKVYHVGDIRRHMAREKSLTIAEFNKLGESDPTTDKQPDEYQKKLGEEQDNFVIDGRTSFHFIPKSVKVYLDAHLEERAKRVFKDERVSEHFHNMDDVRAALAEREKSDSSRYKNYYNIDCFNKENYDLVIDTTNMKPEDIVDKILLYLREKKLIK
jgi:predicted cytidylate kinase